MANSSQNSARGELRNSDITTCDHVLINVKLVAEMIDRRCTKHKPTVLTSLGGMHCFAAARQTQFTVEHHIIIHVEITSLPSLQIFKRALKTELFRRS